MRDPAVAWPPLTETRSLRATGIPRRGCSASSAAGPSPRATARRASAASASSSAPSLKHSQALRAWFWRSARSRWATASSRAVTSPARSRVAISWAYRRVTSASVIGPLLPDDRRDDDEVALARRGVGQRLGRGERRAHDVLAQDVLELDRLGRRRDRVRVELGQLRVLVEDVVELALEAAELLLGQAEAGQVSDVSDILAGQSHGPMISAAA